MNASRSETFAECHRRSLADPDGFWAEQARLVDWQRPFDTVCDASRPPFVNCFVGGTTNLCHNAVARPLATRAPEPALPPGPPGTGTPRPAPPPPLRAARHTAGRQRPLSPTWVLMRRC